MPDVVSVVFRDGGKIYHFDPHGLELAPGDQVVVDTARGIDFGRVVKGPEMVPESDLPQGLKKVKRKATAADLETVARNASFEREAVEACQELVDELRLQMKLAAAEVSFDGGKVLITFTADERVDFRELVSRLGERLKRRVELKQISARDEARIVGGHGPCGRRLCCSLFAGNQEPVSIRMAKDQSLPLNPMKISGMCGRLMCCLKYEHEVYVAFKRRAPKKGSTIDTPAGRGRVVELLATTDSIVVDMGEGRFVTYALAEVSPVEEER